MVKDSLFGNFVQFEVIEGADHFQKLTGIYTFALLRFAHHDCSLGIS